MFCRFCGKQLNADTLQVDTMVSTESNEPLPESVPVLRNDVNTVAEPIDTLDREEDAEIKVETVAEGRVAEIVAETETKTKPSENLATHSPSAKKKQQSNKENDTESSDKLLKHGTTAAKKSQSSMNKITESTEKLMKNSSAAVKKAQSSMNKITESTEKFMKDSTVAVKKAQEKISDSAETVIEKSKTDGKTDSSSKEAPSNRKKKDTSNRVPKSNTAESKFKQLLSTRNGKIICVCACTVLVLLFCFATHIICFHDWAEATCTEPETCKICNRTRGDALGHDYAEATCTEPQKCKVCGETNGEALGHDVAEWTVDAEATCEKGGKKHGTCTRCSEEVVETQDALGHDWSEWKTTKPATTVEEGEKTRKCSRCNKKEKEAIPVMSQEELDEQLEKKFPIVDAITIMELYGKQMYPYGFKMHSAMGVIAEKAYDENTWFLKYQVTITNMFGAKYDTVVEARIAGSYSDPDIQYFYVYE